jgi:hypothetical protein
VNSVTCAQRLIVAEYRGYKAQSLLGAILACQKKFAEAEPLLLSGYEGLARRVMTIPAVDRPSSQQASDRVLRL